MLNTLIRQKNYLITEIDHIEKQIVKLKEGLKEKGIVFDR